LQWPLLAIDSAAFIHLSLYSAKFFFERLERTTNEKKADKKIIGEIDKNSLQKYFNNISGNKIVYIDDKKGLDSILEETSKNRFQEWGTVLNAEFNNDTTIITSIMDHKQALSEGIVKKGGITSVYFDIEKESEYRGTHHYHPNIITRLFSSMHYAIGPDDREIGGDKTIHLLSFNNIHKEPEIIVI